MRVLHVVEAEGRYVASLREAATPTLRPGEVLIRVAASGVNRADLSQIAGRYPAPPGEPQGLGLEVSGTVEGSDGWVCALLAGGGHAEYAAAPEGQVFLMPARLEPVAAAGIPEAFLTAFVNLVVEARVEAGQTVLVHAGASGVGLAAIQIARYLGARVIATVGTQEKAKLACEAGADDVILYAQQDFEVETKRLTDGKGVHVIYDGVGKTTFDKDLEVLRQRGYLVLFGASSGPVPPFDLAKLGHKGSLFITRPTLVHHMATNEELQKRATDVLTMIATGRIKLRIEHIYPLKEAQQAHRELEARKTTGKLLLIP